MSRLDNTCEKPCCIDRKGHSLIASRSEEVDELRRHSPLSIYSTQDAAATKQRFKTIKTQRLAIDKQDLEKN